MTTEVSHGRGGAGNFNNGDETEYVDGKVVRIGVEGSHGDGAYSSGRGGESSIFSTVDFRYWNLYKMPHPQPA